MKKKVGGNKVIITENDVHISNEEMKQEWLRENHENEENTDIKERIWCE